MSDHTVLYLGDTSLAGAAGYLAGVMTHWDIAFDYIDSETPASPALLGRRRLFILSDYPAHLMSAAVQQALLEQVSAGAGLIMIGGWESYFGMGGNWTGTLIGDALPVILSTADDRINCDQPALLLQAREHPIAAGLPWADRPPTIGGFNRLSAKPDSTIILEVERYAARREGGAGGGGAGGDGVRFIPRDRHPMLVLGARGRGRTAALATDVAPHWVGGLVDWGTGRVAAQAPGAGAIEVGDFYARFLRQLLDWTRGAGE